MARQDTDNYQHVFLNDIPLLDVRAPIEFARGAFPNSQNIPLLDDQQREAVGTRYKQQGQDAAIALGLELATPEIREQRMQHWAKFIHNHPLGFLYCFRGGLRSRTTQIWLKQQGIEYPLIKGGYKDMRNFLLQQLEVSIQQIPFIILCGLTGSGKTMVLRKTRYYIDLENLAHHRGSAFGRNVMDCQPSQINWENQLSIICLKHRTHQPETSLLLEDEGRLLGRIVLPSSLYTKMEHSPRIFLERNLEDRVQIIRKDYIANNWPDYRQQYHPEAEEKFSDYVLNNLYRIKNRLGGTRYSQIKSSFELALQHLFSTGESDLFDDGIQLLLQEYYDPMYHYQLQKKAVKISFRGTESEILSWIESHSNLAPS